MNWIYVTETLMGKYQLHNTAVGLAFLFVLCVIYLKFSINTNDNNHKFNFLGGQLEEVKTDIKDIKIENKDRDKKTAENAFKISAIDKAVIKLQDKWSPGGAETKE